MSQEVESLHQEFQHGRPAALLDALALCRMGSTPIPTWIIDALLAKRDAVALALKPPAAQTISPSGADMALWGGIDRRYGVGSVPAGTAAQVRGGRAKALRQRESEAEKERLNFLKGAYAKALTKGTTRAKAITEVHAVALMSNLRISRSQVARILKDVGTHKRRT